MDAFVCDAIRTPIGRYAGALSAVRTDDLAALPIAELLARNPGLDPKRIDEVFLGCANQAGEDNRNVARMAALLAGLPTEVPGITVNRLCASGMDAVGLAARGLACGAYDMVIAGGVESMSRAPLAMPKADAGFSRRAELYDTTIGWRFVNPLMEETYGIDSMPQTADNVAEAYDVARADQDRFALRSQQKWQTAFEVGVFDTEIMPVLIPQQRQDPKCVTRDEHPRPQTDLAALSRLKGINGAQKSVTAGNASGINDGAAALLMATGEAAAQAGLTPMARVLGMAAAGVAPSMMGMGPVPATRRVLKRLGLAMDDMDIIEINEAFASQGLACLRELRVADADPRVNPNGGAIAMGHPLGMTGARMVLTAAYGLQRWGKRYALCTLCVGVGQGVALVLERA